MKLRSKIESEEQNNTGALVGLMRLVRAFRTFLMSRLLTVTNVGIESLSGVWLDRGAGQLGPLT